MKKLNLNYKEGNIKYLYFLLAIVVAIVSLMSVGIGVAEITPTETLEILINKLFKTPLSEDITSGQLMIITQIRLPRIAMALLVGANLAVSGAIYQALFRNAMADPFMLGISSGASLGAGIGFVVGGFVPFYAFIGALIANVLVMTLGGMRGKTSSLRLLLGGMAINYLFSSFLSLIRIASTDRNLMLFSWGMGSLSGASDERLYVLATVSLPILVLFFVFGKELNMLLLGEEHAKSLGVNVERVRLVFLVLSSILIATTVSFTGTIGFVGLIIPHMVRLLFGSNYKVTLLINMLFGMLFVVICDNISRALLVSSEIPLGIVTALIGAPYFMYLIYREHKRSLT